LTPLIPEEVELSLSAVQVFHVLIPVPPEMTQKALLVKRLEKSERAKRLEMALPPE
jgi:hypothetical protein